MGFSPPQQAQSPRGIMLLAPEYRAMYETWRVTQSGCQLRIYPSLGPDGNALPIRAGRSLGDVGNWVNADHYGIQFMGGEEPGKEKVTMLLTIKGDDQLADPSQRRGLRIWDQLRSTLYWRLSQGTAPPHWSKWVTDTQRTVFGPKSKSKAKPYAFFRGLCTHYIRDGQAVRNISVNQPKLNCVFYATPAAQKALIDLTMEELDGATNYHGDDFNQVFKYNSKLVHPDTGCLINFGKPGQPMTQANGASAPTPVNFNGGMGAASVANTDDSQYRVTAHLHEDRPCPIPREVLNQFCAAPLNSILKVWEDEADLVNALEIGFPDELLIEAFKDEPGILSPRLLAKMQQSHNKAAGGNVVTPNFTRPATPVVNIPTGPVTIPGSSGTAPAPVHDIPTTNNPNPVSPAVNISEVPEQVSVPQPVSAAAGATAVSVDDMLRALNDASNVTDPNVQQ